MKWKRFLFRTSMIAAFGLSVYTLNSWAGESTGSAGRDSSQSEHKTSCEEVLVFKTNPSKYKPVQGNLWTSETGVLAEVQPFTLNSKQNQWGQLKERQKKLDFEAHQHAGILGMTLAIHPKALVRFVKEELVFDRETQMPSWEWQIFEGHVLSFEEKPYQSGLRVVLEKDGEEIELDIPAKSGYTLSYFVKSKKE